MADYGAIVDAIDAQILLGVAQPGELDVDGKKIKFRSLGELVSARKYYNNLARRAAGKLGFGRGKFSAVRTT